MELLKLSPDQIEKIVSVMPIMDCIKSISDITAQKLTVFEMMPAMVAIQLLQKRMADCARVWFSVRVGKIIPNEKYFEDLKDPSNLTQIHIAYEMISREAATEIGSASKG